MFDVAFVKFGHPVMVDELRYEPTIIVDRWFGWRLYSRCNQHSPIANFEDGTIEKN